MPAERLRGTSIVWQFAITSFIVLGLIGVGIAALRAGELRASSEEAAQVRAELIAESVIAPLLAPEDLAGPVIGVRYRELDRTIREFAMEDAGVERVKIWNHDGMVVFSNDQEQVGLEPELEEDLLEAFEGEVASEISDLSEAENTSERALADQLFETYVPINLSGGTETDEVDAVIEVYQDYSAIQEEIDRLNDTLKISLGIGLLALYVLLVPVMVGTTRTLRRQNAQLLDQADQLGVLLAREQETVAELRELDRLKSDFAAAASHELRTPLTTIRGFAELLKQQAPPRIPERGMRSRRSHDRRLTYSDSSGTSFERRSSNTVTPSPSRNRRQWRTCSTRSGTDSRDRSIVSTSRSSTTCRRSRWTRWRSMRSWPTWWTTPSSTRPRVRPSSSMRGSRTAR